MSDEQFAALPFPAAKASPLPDSAAYPAPVCERATWQSPSQGHVKEPIHSDDFYLLQELANMYRYYREFPYYDQKR